MNRMILASNIVYLRHQKRMSQKDLAEQMGISVCRLNNWEEGRAFPKLSAFLKLCDCLGDKDIYKLITTPLR